MTGALDRPTQRPRGRRLSRVHLRRLPIIARIVLLIAATGVGLLVGFGLGLGLIRLVQALVGDFPTHSLRGLVVIASAYAVTGLTGLAALAVAWLGLFRRQD